VKGGMCLAKDVGEKWEGRKKEINHLEEGGGGVISLSLEGVEEKKRKGGGGKPDSE